MKAPSELGWESTEDAGIVRIALTGELDASSVDGFERAVGEIARDREIVVLDLGRLDFIDSAGLRCLLRVRDRVEKQGGRLFLASVSTPVERVLSVTGLHRYMEGAIPTEAPSRRGGLRRRPWA